MLEQLKEAARDWLGPSPDQLAFASQREEQQTLNAISLEYSCQDLRHATKNFSAENRLGAGAAGAVYRGVLRGGTEVAIKVILDNGGLGGFEDEVRVLSRFRHPNLVTLLGWGHTDGEKYLVYELLTGGDVSKRLEKAKKGQSQFTWGERLRVAHDAAKGLSYMMNSEPKAFHRDIKPPNILLDIGGGAKMADFGLASTVTDARKHLTVEQISGTPGYACPVYIQTGKVTEHAEVYSFGICLLELLLNQPPALSGPQGEIVYPLLQIVQPNVPGVHKRVLQALDRTAAWPPDVVAAFADHAISCVDMNPNRRPNFETVVKVLRNLCNKTGAPTPAPQPPPQQQQQGFFNMPGLPGGNFLGGMNFGLGGMGMGNAPDNRQRGTTPPPGGYAGSSARRGTTPPAAYRTPPPAGYGHEKSSSSTAPSHSELAEVVLEAETADSVNLAAISRSMKAIVFSLDGNKGHLVVGRQSQTDFFEKLVPLSQQLQTVSRSHFELSWEPGAKKPTLRKLSPNPLFIDGKLVEAHESKEISDGTRVGFAPTPDAHHFLVLRVTLRNKDQVRKDGPHPAASARKSTRSSGSSGVDQMSTIRPPGSSSVVAVLECTFSRGGDPKSLPSDARAIPIEFEVQQDIGRQHQPPNFYETLLHKETKWLNFISRSHCRVLLQRLPDAGRGSHSASDYGLRIENLSSNPVYARGNNLAKGRSETLQENDVLTFVANPGGTEGETKFLEFVLRRARNSS